MRNDVITAKMILHADKVLKYCEGCGYEEFSEDTKLVEACVFNLSQIGELAHRVDKEFSQGHPEIPWRFLYGLRNRIVHDYEGVNLRLIWEIIQEDLPPLREALCKIDR